MERSLINIILHPKKGAYSIYFKKGPGMEAGPDMNSCVEVKVDNEFSPNALSSDNLPLILNAHIAVIEEDEKKISSMGTPFEISEGGYRGVLGKGRIYRLMYEPVGGYSIGLEIISFEDKPYVLLRGFLENISGETRNIANFSPLETLASSEGGIFIDEKPEKSIIFENGLGAAFEFFMRSFNASEESDSSLMEFIYSKNDIRKNLLIGILSLPETICEIITNDEEDEGLKVSIGAATGYDNVLEGIAEFRAQITYPFPKKLFPGDMLTTGLWIITFNNESGFKALEQYANLIREYNGFRLWPHEVPHGWNSWNNPVKGFEQYSYITKINENIILDNMEIAIRKLGPFGLIYWQLDNGYSPDNIMTLDDIMEDRFPHGLQWLANQIRKRGLIPGIWINPFNVGIDSKIFKEKEPQGWFPEPDPSFPINSSSWRPLDLSIPEVQHYIKRAIHKVVYEWGFKLLKVDFAYLNMAPTAFFDPRMTAPEIHRLGWKLIREAAGKDTFIFGIGGPIGLHYGMIDGERITLDTLPQFHLKNMEIDRLDVPQTEGNLFFNYRTMARRYFYNYRVWINHLDCLSFRPSLKHNEAMLLLTAVGMLGGIWKIGDKLEDFKEEHFEAMRKILPIHKFHTRPLDIFEKLVPEILHFSYTLKGDTQPTNIFAFMNWGPNKYLYNEQTIPRGKRIISYDLSKLSKLPKEAPTGDISQEYGANANGDENGKIPYNLQYHVFDFWNERYLGTVSDEMSFELDDRRYLLVALRVADEYPQYLSSNRHIAQGFFTIENFSRIFENKRGRIGLDLKLISDYEYRFYFYVPDKYDRPIVELKSNDTVDNRINIHFDVQLTNDILRISVILNRTDTGGNASGVDLQNMRQKYPVRMDLIFK